MCVKGYKEQIISIVYLSNKCLEKVDIETWTNEIRGAHTSRLIHDDGTVIVIDAVDAHNSWSYFGDKPPDSSFQHLPW